MRDGGASGDRIAFLYDNGAEEALIGTMLLRGSVVELAARALVSADFYKPAHARIFDAAGELYGAGTPVDPVTVYSQLNDDARNAIGGSSVLVRLQSAAPSTANAQGYIDRIRECSARRRIHLAAQDAMARLEGGMAALQVSDALVDDLAKVDMVSRELVTVDFEELVEKSLEQMPEWLIEGVMRRRNRLMITAPTKTGKMTMIRQIAFCVSRGIHPFTRGPIPPRKVLMLDLENPAETYIEPAMKAMVDRIDYASTMGGHGGTRGNLQVLMRGEGLDLRARSDRLLLEDLLARQRPDILCICPVYKSFRKDSRMASDELVEEVVGIFDNLRTRFDCSLILEHHSARGSAEMFPFGSSVWERWVDFGRTMKRAEDNPKKIEWGTFCSADRIPVTWPEAFVWGNRGLPFEPIWPAGHRVDQ